MPQYGIQAMGMLSVHDHSDLTQGGPVPAGSLVGHSKAIHDALKIVSGQFGISGNLTISVGQITVTTVHHNVDTEGAAGADNLDTINGGTFGQILILEPHDALHVVTIRDQAVSGGNIYLDGDVAFAMNNTYCACYLLCYGAYWIEKSRMMTG